ncbi:MAG: TetR/AcrR family transcriptional regulator [Microthrixaceae bacterium]
MGSSKNKSENTSESVADIARARLVEAGCELVLEHFRDGTGLREVFAYLNAGAVSQRAGLSRGLLYHYWGGTDSSSDARNLSSSAFESYLLSVLAELLSKSAVPEELAELSNYLPANMSDIILEITTSELERITGDDAPLWHSIDMLALHGLINAQESETTLERLDQMWKILLEKIDREPRPPLGYRELSIVSNNLVTGFANPVIATQEGLWKRYDWQETVPRESSTHEWTLLAISMESVVLGMTQPRASEPKGQK